MGWLAIKRAYAPPEASDGKRILVDRLWPRGLRRTDAGLDDWMKDVAPSPALRKWFGHQPARFAAFGERYRAELDGNPEPVERLCTMVRTHDVTLIYAARDARINHARVLADYLGGRGSRLKEAE